MRMARSRNQLAPQFANLLDPEPVHLHITPCDVHPIVTAIAQRTHAMTQTGQGILEGVTERIACPAKLTSIPMQENMELASFQYLIEQFPAVRTIEFSGATDPFRNSDLLAMVVDAHQINGAESTIVTDGLLLHIFMQDILKSPLRTLAVKMYAHRPSDYARLSGNPASQFVQIRDHVAFLLQQRNQSNSELKIELRMTVDLHNIRQLPDMIFFARDLGVDGVRFENYLSPLPGQPSDKTLYSHHAVVKQILGYVRNNVMPYLEMELHLPVPLDADMSQHRYCGDPFTTVSIDTAFNVSACSRQQLYYGEFGKIWDEDVWNNPMYRWLRGVHDRKSSSQGGIPLACQQCPRNIPCNPDLP